MPNCDTETSFICFDKEEWMIESISSIISKLEHGH